MIFVQLQLCVKKSLHSSLISSLMPFKILKPTPFKLYLINSSWICTLFPWFNLWYSPKILYAIYTCTRTTEILTKNIEIDFPMWLSTLLENWTKDLWKFTRIHEIVLIKISAAAWVEALQTIIQILANIERYISLWLYT